MTSLSPARSPRRPTRPTNRIRVVLTTIAGVGLLAGALTLADALGLARGPAGDVTSAVATPRAAPPLAGPTLDGSTADLAQLRGQVVVVTVWASWCAPCRDELPVLAAGLRELAPQGVAFLGVETRDNADSAKVLLQQTGAGALTSVKDPDGSLAVSWGATGVPETFVIDREGLIRARNIGAVNAQWLSSQVARFVGGGS